MLNRIYIDTSVVGGYFDPEFAGPTQAFFAQAQTQQWPLLTSDVLAQELTRAPPLVRDLLTGPLALLLEPVTLTPEAIALADSYLREKVVGKTSRADCLHIALATVARATVLVSWNFKHVVNLSRIRGYNAINMREGYPMLEIRSPRELLLV